jgi:hypothetical protein
VDKTKSPGISLESIQLMECSVGNVSPEKDLKFSLGITDLKRTTLSDGKVLTVFVGFDLMKGLEKPPCKFTCSYLATYTRSQDSNMTWEEFKDHIAVAHLIPFVREFVSNITTRMPLSGLMLPPINTHELVAEYLQPTLEPSTKVAG